jgi:hypothetical protein
MLAFADQDVSQAALRPRFVGAFAAIVGASVLVGGSFLPNLPECAARLGGERNGKPILFARHGRFAGPARFGEDVCDDDR